MKTLQQVDELRTQIAQWRQQQLSIGFVPTMGNLHAGHLALVDEARRHADKIVVSIFVNPTQFGPNEDLDHYPRTEQADAEQLKASAVDVLFLPSVETMYGDIENTTVVRVPILSDILCGASRQGHFDGVATVVSKLFNLVQPDIAVFGEKDFQQLTLLRQLVKDLAFPVQVIACPTHRETDGLAMSSRNQYLTEDERQRAPALFATLSECVKRVKMGEKNLNEISKEALTYLEEKGFIPEYVEIRRQKDLKVPQHGDKMLVVLVAASLGKTRLIDNVTFEVEYAARFKD